MMLLQNSQYLFLNGLESASQMAPWTVYRQTESMVEIRYEIYINQSHGPNTHFFVNVAFCQGEYIHMLPRQLSNSPPEETLRQKMSKRAFMTTHLADTSIALG